MTIYPAGLPHRHCIDTMLAEVKGHVSSHGTRVFLQLLTRTSPHLTAQSSERVFLAVCVLHSTVITTNFTKFTDKNSARVQLEQSP